MNPSIRQLQAFVAVAQARSLAEASERIHLSQPALSIAIRKMEETIGGPLFDRSARQLSLTPEGEAFLPAATRLLGDWAQAFDDLHELFSKQRGKVTIAALPTLAAGFLPRVIAELRAHHPRINLGLHDALGEQINQMVEQGRADLGLTVPPQATDTLAFEGLLDDHYVAVCPVGHPLLEQREVVVRQPVEVGRGRPVRLVNLLEGGPAACELLCLLCADAVATIRVAAIVLTAAATAAFAAATSEDHGLGAQTR